MKHIKSLILALAWFLPLLGFAYDIKVDGIYYNIHDGEAIVSSRWDTTYIENGQIVTEHVPEYRGDITIPECITYMGTSYPVTGIEKASFCDCSELTSIVFPAGIKTIGDGAFWGCSSLRSLHLPDSVEEIGDYAFLECSKLESVRLPNTITTFGYDIFGACKSLPVENGIRYADNYLVEICNKEAEECVIKEGTCYIGNKAFSWSLVREVKLPSSVVFVCPQAFENCIGLERIYANENLKAIGFNAFSSCDNLKEIHLQDGLISIGACAFYFCSQLEYAPLPSSLKELGINAFYGTGLTSVHIPSEVDNIPSNCFCECQKLTSLTIDEGVKGIDSQAFQGTPLSSLVLPSSIERLGAGAFTHCTNLADVTVLAPIPPVASFYTSDHTSTLHILPGCREAYAQAEGWKMFKNIVEDAENPNAISHPQQSIGNEPSTLYDLQGRKVGTHSRKGLYIKDGRKVVR